MHGETNLQILLKNMTPELNSGDYVFCTVKHRKYFKNKDIIGFFKEKEGYTVILPKSAADTWGLEYTYIMTWITLKIHSALDAVGLTAAFSNALASANISCNVVAGFYHDHIFVGKDDAEKAMKVLKNLS
jgi:uncharacterized protein